MTNCSTRQRNVPIDPPTRALRGVHNDIQDYQFHVAGVNGSKPYAYTVGLAGYGLSELVLTGAEFTTAVRALNFFGNQILDGLDLTDLALVADCEIWPVHPSHIAGGLVDRWKDYYGLYAPTEKSPVADFCQLVLGPSHFCSCHPVVQPDLSAASPVFEPLYHAA